MSELQKFKEAESYLTDCLRKAPFAEAGRYLSEYLHKVAAASSDVDLDLDQLPEELRPFGEDLRFFGKCAVEMTTAMKELARGNLSHFPFSNKNEMAAPLKMLRDRFEAQIGILGQIGENLVSVNHLGYTSAVNACLKNLCITFRCSMVALWCLDDGVPYRWYYWPQDLRGIPRMNGGEWPASWLDTLAVDKYVVVNQLDSWPGSFSRDAGSCVAVPLSMGGSFMGFVALVSGEKNSRAQEYLSVIKAYGLVILSLALAKENENALRTARESALRVCRARGDLLSWMDGELGRSLKEMAELATAGRTGEAENEVTLRRRLYDEGVCAERLLRLLNDAGELARIDAGDVTLESSPFNLEEVLEKTCALVAKNVDRKQQILRVVFGKGIDMNYVGDAARLSIALRGLLENAGKSSPEKGEILLLVSLLEREINGFLRLRFSVSDMGSGMTEKEAGQIFDPASSCSGSAALSLALTKKIVEKMGGSIHVTSVPGAGSTIMFDVEMKIGQEKVPDADFSGLRVLVADANAEMELLSLLDGFGVTPDAALCAADAVKTANTAARSGKPYDLIFTDLNLPDTGGIETVRSFSPEVDRSSVVLTATPLRWRAAAEEAEKAEIRRLLPKPVFPGDLRNVLTARNDEIGKNQATQSSDQFENRILLVDDQAAHRWVVTEMLGDSGIVIDEADSGEAALRMFAQSPENAYALVLIDVQMPGMDGYETAWRLRGTDRSDAKKSPDDCETTWRLRGTDRTDAKNVPIVALISDFPANERDANVQRALEAGMNGYLTKPLDYNALRNLVKRVLKNRFVSREM